MLEKHIFDYQLWENGKESMKCVARSKISVKSHTGIHSSMVGDVFQGEIGDATLQVRRRRTGTGDWVGKLRFTTGDGRRRTE